MTDYILKIKNVTKEFPGVRALNNVSFNVKRGIVFSLCGENGAGKSTLMKVLSGVYPSGTYTGEIYFNHQLLNNKKIKDSERAGISIIHQELNLVKELSVMENIFLGQYIHRFGGIDRNAMFKRTKKLLQEVKLPIHPETPIKELGVGEQQLVEIAKALSKDTKLLILDEPTAPLTVVETDVLMGIINDLRSRGVTCIFISHKLNEVMRISDEVGIIRDGEFIGSDIVTRITKDDIIKMMVGRTISNLFPKEQHDIGEIIFEVKNVTAYDRSNPEIKRVDNISFNLRKGEILGISGLIGSGRTELVSSIFGTYEGKHSGTCYYKGKQIDTSKPSKSLENGIAMVPEDRKNFGLILDMATYKNITLSNIKKYRGVLNYLNAHKEQKDVLKYIEMLRIKVASIDMQVNGLSGGNQQKVVIAKNLLVKPLILILDEPTRGVDVGAKYEIYKLIFKLVKEGISIIMISSELPEILGICDRVLVVHEGKLKADLVNENLDQEKIMAAAIGG
jgi:D-xylose transport system ATP-binding protein